LFSVPRERMAVSMSWADRRGPLRVGVPVRLPVGLPLPPPALVSPTGPKPPCAFAQVRSVPPLRLHLRHRGPSVLNARGAEGAGVARCDAVNLVNQCLDYSIVNFVDFSAFFAPFGCLLLT
jgi:hypothetical protein